MSISQSIHPERDAKVTTSVQVWGNDKATGRIEILSGNEKEGSHDRVYASVSLSFGEFEGTFYPKGESVLALAEGLEAAARRLREAAARLTD